MTQFIYEMIGKVPDGINPGKYKCELIKIETKRNSKSGVFETQVILKVVRNTTAKNDE